VNVTLVLVAIVIFSFVFGHFVTRFASRYVLLSGVEYMLVGVLIGPYVGLDLVGEATLDFLSPLFSLLLGLVGFLVGLRARGAAERVDLAVLGVVSALLVVLGVSGGLLLILAPLIPLPAGAADFVVDHTVFAFRDWHVELHFTSTHLWLALALGAAAAVASPLLVEGIKRRHSAQGRVLTLLESAARVSQIVAVLVLGIVLATARATATSNRFSLTVTEWVLAALGGGILCGLLFGLFIGRESDASRVFLASVGLVTFASGVAVALGISPLFVNLIAGLTVAVASPHAAQLREQLDRLQHPLFVLLMIFAGALWRPVAGWLWILPAAYMVLRFVARRAATSVSARLSLEQPVLVARLGNGLLGQGTLAVAIALDFSLRFPSHAALILTTVLLGTLLSDLFSHRALRTLLADAGELQQETESGAPDEPLEVG